jgi:hypothetical protein
MSLDCKFQVRARFIAIRRDAEACALWLMGEHGTTLATGLRIVKSIGNELVTAFRATSEVSV